MVSIKEDITPNPPFQSSELLLVILRVSSNVDFGDTRQDSLIGSYRMCSENRNKCVLKTEMNKQLDTREQIVGNS